MLARSARISLLTAGTAGLKGIVRTISGWGVLRRVGVQALAIVFRTCPQEAMPVANERTSEEVRADHLAKLGPDLGPVFTSLLNDYSWLWVKWQQYRELYGTSPERIELLNAAANLFFGVIQETLWEDVLLSLCRLTDDAEMRGKRNLSVRRLPLLCADQPLLEPLTSLVQAAVDATRFARDWRNRRIGHRDLKLVLDSGSEPLAPASRADVEAALAAIHAVLNAIHERMLDSTLSKMVIIQSVGAEALLYVLRDGLEADVEKRERIQQGQAKPRDFQRRPI